MLGTTGPAPCFRFPTRTRICLLWPRLPRRLKFTTGVLQTPLGRHPDCCIPSVSLLHMPPATQHTAPPLRPAQC